MNKLGFILITCLLFFFITSNINAQWVGIGPCTTYISCITASSDYLFAGSGSNGLYRSGNNGNSWEASNSGLTIPDILTITSSGSNLFAGTYGRGVFLSTDNGNSWNPVNTGLPDYIVIRCILINGTNMFAGTGGGNGGVYLSVGAIIIILLLIVLL